MAIVTITLTDEDETVGVSVDFGSDGLDVNGGTPAQEVAAKFILELNGGPLSKANIET
jgi:hypothetical protein